MRIGSWPLFRRVEIGRRTLLNCRRRSTLDAQGPANPVRRGGLYRVYKTINPDREQYEVGEDEGGNDGVPDR